MMQGIFKTLFILFLCFCVFFFFFWKETKKEKEQKRGRENNVHSGESNYSSLSNYFVSAKKRKREWNNGILKFVYLYIYSKNPLWLRIISRVKRRFSKVVKLYLLQSPKKKKVVKLDRTVRRG